jgi:DNA adenine methylase
MLVENKMPEYICENCDRVFKQKGHFESHKKRKNPCKKDTRIDKLVEKKVQEILETKGFVEPEYKVDSIKPFLKWVGGKTQILDEVLKRFPQQINNYYEPFVGGGSVLIGLLSYIKAGKITVLGDIYVSDWNLNLVGLYKNIQSNPHELIDELKLLTENTEDYYYTIRSRFNEAVDRTCVQTSAMFLYLNKTCFRGIYREGPRGFNVPFGHYKNPTIVDEEHILRISELIQPVIFTHDSFENALEDVQAGDFVYLDPPYAPETTTSFVKYNSDGFGIKKHQELFDICKSMKAKFLMSNADVSLVKHTFDSEEYTVEKILCRRAIHSKDPSSKTNELLIMN